MYGIYFLGPKFKKVSLYTLLMSDFRSLQNSVTFILMNGPKTEVQLLNSVKVTQHEIIQGCKVLEILKPTCIALELIIRDESHTLNLVNAY